MLKRIIKKLSGLLVLVVSSNAGYAHDTDGFYVIPTGKVIKQEVCNGTPLGNEAFVVRMQSLQVKVGQVFETNTRHIVQITGVDSDLQLFGETKSFWATINNLPPPNLGTKGPYFSSARGKIIYVRFL